jgi:hypothetical protein
MYKIENAVAFGWDALDLVVLDGAYELVYLGKPIQCYSAEWMMDEMPQSQQDVYAVER